MGEEITKRVGVQDIIKSRVGVLAVVGMFYSMCCAGAFGIEEMLPEVGPGMTILMLIVLPFVWALPYSWICAEMGSARPVEGGNILWVKEAMGEYWFAVMVFVNFLWGLTSNTIYVVLATDYLGTVVKLTTFQSVFIKLALVTIFFVINIIGIREVSIVSTVISVMVVAGFLLVAVVGFANWQQNPIEPFMSDAYGGDVFQTVGAGLAIGIWMYSGFDEISLFAGEIKDSHRIIPKALMIVIPLMILTYVLPTMAGMASIGDYENWTTDPDGFGYATVLFEYAPAALGVVFIAIAIAGQCSIYNMCIAVAGRATMILADENFAPRFIANLTKRRGTPYVALTIVYIVTALLTFKGFAFLIVIDVFFTVVVCALTVVSAFILKRRIPAEEFKFKAPGGRGGHNLMCGLVLFFCLATVLINGSDYFLGGILIMLLIPIFYVIGKLSFKGLSKMDPERYPIDNRTGLGYGDLKKMGGMYVGLGLLSSLGRFFLEWYETSGEWAFPDDYEMVFSGSFGGVMTLISVVGGVSVALGCVLFIVGKRLGLPSGGETGAKGA